MDLIAPFIDSALSCVVELSEAPEMHSNNRSTPNRSAIFLAKNSGLLVAMPTRIPAAFTDEMLVLCFVEGKAFHSFLAQLREKKVPVTLKAVLTEHNAQWTSSKLHESLVQEYEMLKSAGKSVHNQ